jgi:hypothetical protein
MRALVRSLAPLFLVATAACGGASSSGDVPDNCEEGPWSATMNPVDVPTSQGTTMPSAFDGCDKPPTFMSPDGGAPDYCHESCEALCLPAPEALDTNTKKSTVTGCAFVLLEGQNGLAITSIKGEPNTVFTSAPVVRCDYFGIAKCDVISPGWPQP